MDHGARTLFGRPGLRPESTRDLRLSAQDRYDDCHMADSGEVESPSVRAAILTKHP
jgi:hypothetical protein